MHFNLKTIHYPGMQSILMHLCIIYAYIYMYTFAFLGCYFIMHFPNSDPLRLLPFTAVHRLLLNIFYKN